MTRLPSGVRGLAIVSVYANPGVSVYAMGMRNTSHIWDAAAGLQRTASSHAADARFHASEAQRLARRARRFANISITFAVIALLFAGFAIWLSL